jgi:hypothetical protein
MPLPQVRTCLWGVRTRQGGGSFPAGAGLLAATPELQKFAKKSPDFTLFQKNFKFFCKKSLYTLDFFAIWWFIRGRIH